MTTSDPEYELVLIDPPWPTTHRDGKSHYPLMSMEEIENLGDLVEEVTTDNSWLFMWSISGRLPEALSLMEKWGYRYRDNLIWCKPRFGLGWLLRHNHEILLVGQKGNPSYNTLKGRGGHGGKKVWPSVLHAPVSAHSHKPDGVYTVCETFTYGPKLEIFARENRSGWDAWGDEVGVPL